MATLHEYPQHLKEKLDNCFVRKDDLDPRKRFARHGVTREILELERLEHLIQHLYPEGADGSHYMTPTNLKNTTEKIRGSANSSDCYNNVLATLLYSKCADETLKEFVKDLLREKPSKLFSDFDLPVMKDTAVATFGDIDGPTFWEDQFLFCPVVLRERDEVTYTGHKQSCPRPFPEDPVKIGRGAFGVVYRVKIERGHLINSQGVNDLNEYAMKEYIGYDAEAKKSFEAEAATIKQFIQSAKSHDNIATTRASLEWGNTYSLFFDLAKCNLWEYLTKDTITMHTMEDKQTVFSQTIGLTGALAYLHDELYLSETNEQLQCYHLDLKPQNILVFETNGKEIWKISDFGISQIKRISPSQHESEHHVSFLEKIFSPRESDEDPSSGVENSRYGGTYAAPEARQQSDTVTRKSDVWSLACVITLVLTFLHNQSEGIDQFQKARGRDRSHDWFFDSKALREGSEGMEILHVSVSTWLDALKEEASKRDRSEAKATEMATDLLRNRMFLRDQEKRLSAKLVERELRNIQFSFTE